MSTTLPESDHRQLKADLSLTFDLAIDSLLAEERFSAGIQVDDESGQPFRELIAQEDDTLTEIVFLCDGRAQLENDEHTPVNEISWVHFAREGIRRVSRTLPNKSGLENTRVFNDLRDQVEAFEDMATRRKIVRGHPDSDFIGLDYAYRVAQGEIVLGK